MTGVRNNMTAQAESLGATIEIVDSQNKQPTQNEQVDTYITKGVNALAVNPVDLTAAGPIIDKASAAGIPIVLLNRQPSEEDMAKYDKTWYVGARAEESGTMSGQIILDYFKANAGADQERRRRDPVRHAPGRARTSGRGSPLRVLHQGHRGRRHLQDRGARPGYRHVG